MTRSSTRVDQIGKLLAPYLARIFLRGPLAKTLPLLESYVAFVQGKGSGTGWDMQVETHIAISHIRRPDAILFDIGAHQGE